MIAARTQAKRPQIHPLINLEFEFYVLLEGSTPCLEVLHIASWLWQKGEEQLYS